jgi:hypothetical protein
MRSSGLAELILWWVDMPKLPSGSKRGLLENPGATWVYRVYVPALALLGRGEPAATVGKETTTNSIVEDGGP